MISDEQAMSTMSIAAAPTPNEIAAKRLAKDEAEVMAALEKYSTGVAGTVIGEAAFRLSWFTGCLELAYRESAQRDVEISRLEARLREARMT